MLARLKRLACLTVAAALALPAGAAAQHPVIESPAMPWQVVERLISGSVIDVRGVGLVRLAGVEDFGEPSRAFLAGLITSQAVRVLATAHSEGGLTHALVYVPDGRCVNVEMLRSGYARVRVEPGFEHLEEFRGLQADAKRLQRGMWAPAPPPLTPAAASASRRTSPAMRRFHFAAGGGSTTDGGGRDWVGAVETGALLAQALGVYASGGYLKADRAWHGSAGLRLIAPISTALRPYVRAGGGYMRFESPAATRRDEPFWEAGGGLLITGGPVMLDAGYTFARAGRTDIARVAGLLGIRF